MESTFVLECIVRIMGCELRKLDYEGRLLKRFANLDEKSDPFCTDSKFLQEQCVRDEKNNPLLICENENIYYAKIEYDEDFYLIGPVCITKNNNEVMRWMFHEHGVNMEDCRVPYCQCDIFLNSIMLMFNNITGKEVDLNDMCNINIEMKQKDAEKWKDIVYEMREYHLPHNPFDHESRKLQSIQEGDLDTLKICQHETWVGKMGKVGDTLLRQEKNMGIIVVVLASRAAIRGGMLPEKAFSMADQYIMNFEKTSDLFRIRQMVYEYEIEFARQVKKKLMNSENNLYIRKAKDYIFKQMHQTIKVSDIGEKLGINKDYLSSIFHQYEGETLQNYIMKQKIYEAEHMLKYTDYTLSQIANTLSFSSQSYFGSCFKKVTGTTPAVYKNIYGVGCVNINKEN